MDLIREFYEENKDWLTPLVSSFLGALVGWITSMLRTRTSRISDLIDGKNIYDDNDLLVIDRDYKRGEVIPLAHFSIVKKGKNAENEKISEPQGGA